MFTTNYNLFKHLSKPIHSRNTKLLILKNFSINVDTALSMLNTSKGSSFKTKTLNNNYSSNQSSVRTLASTRDNIKQSLSKPKELHTLPAIANRPLKLMIKKKKINQRAVSIFSKQYYTPFKKQMNHKKNKIYDIINQINGVKFKVKK